MSRRNPIWLSVPMMVRALVLFFLYSFLVSCGLTSADDTETERDCTSSEYFIESRERCVPCPSVVEPSCRPGCGFEIRRDENNCRYAACVLECNRCPDGEFFSGKSWTCETCESDTSLNCDDLDCLCEPVPYGDVCGTSYCGSCVDPADGWRVQAGQCLRIDAAVE